jgi:hypothetical protein
MNFAESMADSVHCWEMTMEVKNAAIGREAKKTPTGCG